MNRMSVTKSILSYVERNLENDLTLEDIAKELNYSKFYIERVFKEYAGQPLYRYIKNRRLNEAARKLAETGKPIIEIALEAGYHSQQAFTQAFHEGYGTSPQKYRQLGIFVPGQERIDFSVRVTHEMSRLQAMHGRMAA